MSVSAIFKEMRVPLVGIFGHAAIADIEHVFLGKGRPPGMRHAVAHGLLDDAGPYGADAIYACWLIFRLCCIPLSGIRDSIKLPS